MAEEELTKALYRATLQLNACLEVMEEFAEADTTPSWIKENSLTRLDNGRPEVEHAKAVLDSGEDCTSDRVDGVCMKHGVKHEEDTEKPTRLKLIEAARALYEGGDCDIEIDDDAKLSRTDQGGSWVQAWVWVNYEEIEGSEDIPPLPTPEEVRKLRGKP